MLGINSNKTEAEAIGTGPGVRGTVAFHNVPQNTPQVLGQPPRLVQPFSKMLLSLGLVDNVDVRHQVALVGVGCARNPLNAEVDAIHFADFGSFGIEGAQVSGPFRIRQRWKGLLFAIEKGDGVLALVGLADGRGCGRVNGGVGARFAESVLTGDAVDGRGFWVDRYHLGVPGETVAWAGIGAPASPGCVLEDGLDIPGELPGFVVVVSEVGADDGWVGHPDVGPKSILAVGLLGDPHKVNPDAVVALDVVRFEGERSHERTPFGFVHARPSPSRVAVLDHRDVGDMFSVRGCSRALYLAPGRLGGHVLFLREMIRLSEVLGDGGDQRSVFVGVYAWGVSLSPVSRG